MENKMTIHPNAVVAKIKNKRISIISKVPKSNFDAQNVVIFRSLTSETGKRYGSRSALSPNKKVKETLIGLSDEALLALYQSIMDYFIHIKHTEHLDNQHLNK